LTTTITIITTIIVYPGVDGKIKFRWIFRKQEVGYGLDQTGSGQGQVAGTCKCGNETLGSIKCVEFLH
jgi:hypothetical protein